jgi:DNA-binding CsgD family transcriptional regulator
LPGAPVRWSWDWPAKTRARPWQARAGWTPAFHCWSEPWGSTSGWRPPATWTGPRQGCAVWASVTAAGEGAPDRSSAGKSLTPTEERVVDLVAEGLTNPQIGERLYVSPRTVQTHLAHIFAKLGVSTRAQLAAQAAHQQAR